MRQATPLQPKIIIRISGKTLALFCLLLCAACDGARPPALTRIALLAPFEGRYREVGYNALYAARLAFQDGDGSHIELLAVDDGGDSAHAVDRARALASDPLVKVVVALGYATTDPATQRTYGHLPVLVVGDWDAQPETNTVFILSHPQVSQSITIPARIGVTDAARLPAPFTGGDVLALEQFRKLRPDLSGIAIVSSASLPDATFRERYRSSAEFAPEPGLLATLTYDAVRMALIASQTNNPHETLTTMHYAGLNGTIRFEKGYWADAPVYRYRFDANGQLTLAEDRPVK
jgi:hypothetical protein